MWTVLENEFEMLYVLDYMEDFVALKALIIYLILMEN